VPKKNVAKRSNCKMEANLVRALLAASGEEEPSVVGQTSKSIVQSDSGW
jgi:hypothetical protein